MIIEDGTGTSRLAEVDNENRLQTRAVTIAYANYQIRKGTAYTAEVVAADGIGTKATLTFTTPDNSEKLMHLIVHSRSNIESFYTLGENPTITGGTGTNFIVYNRNRNSVNTSQAFGTRTVVRGQMTGGATVTSFGTILEQLHFGNGKVGGEDRASDEWILKRNTTYAFEVESEAASSDVMIEIDWYENGLY